MNSNYRQHRKIIRRQARWCKHCRGSGERVEVSMSDWEVRLYMVECRCREGVTA